MADSSFDVVSKYDMQEVDNAVNQTAKEINQRYDFKGVDASVELKGETITMKANSEERVLAVYDVLQTKLVRRGVSLKSVDVGEGEFGPGQQASREDAAGVVGEHVDPRVCGELLG